MNLSKLYGVHYYNTSEKSLYQSTPESLYFFQTYIGEQSIDIETGDSAYYFSQDLQKAIVARGKTNIKSYHLCTVVRGYTPPNTETSLFGVTTLPYINGCSTRQIFPPIRIGDPTLQLLKIPPGSKEQEHHIHSTYRVVYILSGSGKSIVGIDNNIATTELYPGRVCIFEPMSPHHFSCDENEPLIAIPLHIFSSAGGAEQNHPMFNGTIRM